MEEDRQQECPQAMQEIKAQEMLLQLKTEEQHQLRVPEMHRQKPVVQMY